MAKVIETIERDGIRVNVYDNGMEKNADNGHFIKPPDGTMITAQNASVFVRRRQEKTAAALRSAIVAETMDKLQLPHTSSIAAVAAAGAILWREIVLADPDTSGVYPRDRLEAWEKIGKHAQVLGDTKQAAEAPTAGDAAVMLDKLTALIRILKEEHQPRDVVEGTVVQTWRCACGYDMPTALGACVKCGAKRPTE